MRIFCLLSLATLTTAAFIPINNLQLHSDETYLDTHKQNLNTVTHSLSGNGYTGTSTIHRLKYRQRRDISEIDNVYLPPTEESATEASGNGSPEMLQDSAVLGDNGYEYKSAQSGMTDIAGEYLPPAKEAGTPMPVELATEEQPQDTAVLGDNGYEYKSVRRLKYRQRRDVSEIANVYLPPTEETEIKDVTEKKAPEPIQPKEITAEEVADIKQDEEPQESAVLADNGYEYKTVRRLKYRQRRDVSEIANVYLPPAEEAETEGVPEGKLTESQENPSKELADINADEASQESALLGDNGYEYKTVRRLKYRQRRDVGEIPNEYLPPKEDIENEKAPEESKEPEVMDETVMISENAAIKSDEESQETAVLGDNGYEYKTVRRLKYRQRRDVSEIPNDYIPPADETAELKSEEAPQETAVLGNNGYEYKTVRRLKYRQRREVSEIPNVYLPPADMAETDDVSNGMAAEIKDAEEISVKEEIKSDEPSQESAILGDNGYEYKTVRRLKYRQRRDVSEISNEYLAPTKVSASESPAEMNSDENSAVLGVNGYEYKTVRRLKYRQRRDVAEIANEYLPPAEELEAEMPVEAGTNEGAVDILPEMAADIKSEEEPQESAVLGNDGYEYKTVRRLKYRQRRDVSDIANEYLPPAEETATEKTVEVKSEEQPLGSAVLGDNGYEYITFRRRKFRQRRDVSEIASVYLPPTEESRSNGIEEVKTAEEPTNPEEMSAKVVEDTKSDEEPQESAVKVIEDTKPQEEPQESAVLGENGYEYKTVRRLKYRQRRDVAEIPKIYLPPVTEGAIAAEDAEVKAAEENQMLSNVSGNEETLPEVIMENPSTEQPQDSAVLGDNGYEYKTVRRLNYRQ